MNSFTSEALYSIAVPEALNLRIPSANVVVGSSDSSKSIRCPLFSHTEKYLGASAAQLTSVMQQSMKSNSNFFIEYKTASSVPTWLYVIRRSVEL